MAKIDDERGVAVVRIVYDGSPMSGKTTNIHALHEELKLPSEVFSPEEENGRTRYFDWLDYQGGNFSGYPISAQVLSVPGQPSLYERRKQLLQTADVVIFVLDSDPAALATGLEYFRSLQQLLENIEPPIKVIIQANKQDLPNAIGEDMLKMFFPPESRIMTSIASEQQGVRDTFVLAVSMAVERLKTLQDSGVSDTETVLIDNAEALFEVMSTEAELPVSEENALLESFIETSDDSSALLDADETNPSSSEAVALPSSDTPLLWVFPSAAGHVLLENIAALDLEVEQNEQGDWQVPALSGGWRCVSLSDWLYDSPETALAALRKHVRAQIRLSALLAEKHCVAIAPAENAWRIWQISWSDYTLQDELQMALSETNPESFANSLLRCTRDAYRACKIFSEYLPLSRLTPSNISLESPAVFIGTLDPAELNAKQVSDEELCIHLQEIFAPLLMNSFAQGAISAEDVAENIQAEDDEDEVLVNMLLELLAVSAL